MLHVGGPAAGLICVPLSVIVVEAHVGKMIICADDIHDPLR